MWFSKITSRAARLRKNRIWDVVVMRRLCCRHFHWRQCRCAWQTVSGVGWVRGALFRRLPFVSALDQHVAMLIAGGQTHCATSDPQESRTDTKGPRHLPSLPPHTCLQCTQTTTSGTHGAQSGGTTDFWTQVFAHFFRVQKPSHHVRCTLPRDPKLCTHFL